MKMWKKGFTFVCCSLVLASCSSIEKETTASAPLEAASVEWVEGEVKSLSNDTVGLDERIAKLEKEIGDVAASEPVVFKDVQSDYWAYKEIMNLSENGIIKGYPDVGLFYPERSITRYQAASMIIKALDLPLSKSPSVFKDVSSSHPGMAEIMTVYENGIFNGSNGSFLPNEPMKRRHMAMVLQRAFELKETDVQVADYRDVNPNLEGYDAIKIISQHGIATGSNGNFMPESPTKRSQFSAFIYRTLQVK